VPYKEKSKNVNERIEVFPTSNEQIKKGTKRGAATKIDKEEETENDTCVWGVRDRMESDVPASVLVAIVVSCEGAKPQKKKWREKVEGGGEREECDERIYIAAPVIVGCRKESCL